MPSGAASETAAWRDVPQIVLWSNLGTPVSLISQALRASCLTGMPLAFAPLLLLGEPGVGKTFVTSKIAEAIASKFLSVSMTMATSVNPLGGTSQHFKNPKIGALAQALTDGSTASPPLVLLDEVDKPLCLRGEADPLDLLCVLLEPESSRSFQDEFAELVFAADAALWIATAIGTDRIAPSILDPMLVLQI